MKINKLSFITPLSHIPKEKIVLEKTYSQEYQLLDGTSISLASNIGNRKNQQDSIAITQNGNYTLLLVADGVGGLSEGEKASYTTAKIIKKWLETESVELLKTLNPKNLEDAITALMYLISTEIPINSGSTLNMSIICPDKTFIINIGDSRTYTIKDGKITLRTKDDSLIFNRFNPQTGDERDKLRFHKKSNIILNSISKSYFPKIKVTTIENEEYDTICHVTDGVTDYLTESQILSYLEQPNPAYLLVENSVNGEKIYSGNNDTEEFKEFIEPGEDNSTAIVYIKKRTKNNK